MIQQLLGFPAAGGVLQQNSQVMQGGSRVPTKEGMQP